MRIIGNNPDADNAEITAVASGALANGSTVVVNTDGTVSVVGETVISEAVGTPTTFGSGVGYYNAVSFDSNSNRIVIAYRDNNNSDYGTAVVATVNSNNTLTLGTPVVFISSHTQDVGAVFDSSNNKIVICFKDAGNSYYGKAVVGTVDSSDNSISFGSVVTYSTATTSENKPVFDSSNNKIVITFFDSSPAHGRCIVGTVSGTSISFGSSVSFNSGTTAFLDAAYDSSNNKVIVVYTDSAATGNPLNARVATVSGTSISFGTEVTVLSTETQYNSAVFDENSGKVVVSYMDENNSNYGTSKVGTVSGTSISFGSAVVWEQGESQYISGVYDSVAKQVVLFYNDGDDSGKGKVVSGTVSGTGISYSSATQFEAGNTQSLAAGYAASGKSVALYMDNGNSNLRTYVVYQNSYSSTNLTSENYIGMSSGVVVPSSLGSATAFDSGSNPFVQAAYDTNSNKVVISYKDNSNSSYGTAVVGTVSGTSISFGTPVVFAAEAMSTSNPVVFDSSNNKIVISFKASDASGKAIVGTVSGTSISFGSAAQFESATVTPPITSCFDSSSNKVFIAYGKSTNGYGIVATVSGTSISFGSAAAFDSSIGGTPYISSAFDSPNSKVVVAYKDGNNSGYGTTTIGTISGTSVSFGTPVVFAAVAVATTKTVFDSANGKIVHSYYASGVAAKARVGTVSGTSISYGTEASVTSTVGAVDNIAFDSSRNQIVVLISISANPYNLKAFTGSVSGTDIAFGSAFNITAAGVYNANVVHDPDSKINIAAYNTGSNGTAQTFNTELRGEVPSGTQAIIDIGSAISTNQTSLTAGQQYFVQTDGTIGTTAADPSVIAGTAISATEIIVKG